MANRTGVIIGVHGEKPTTHCAVSGRPLNGAPVNYSLGQGYYVSCNAGLFISVDDLAKFRFSLPAPDNVIFNLNFKEELTNDNQY